MRGVVCTMCALGLGLGCDDAASGPAEPGPGVRDARPDGPPRPPPDLGGALPEDAGSPADAARSFDAGPSVDAAPDAGGPARACFEMNDVLVAGGDRLSATTDAEGRLRVYAPSRRGYWTIEGAPGSPAVLVFGARSWTLLLTPEAAAPTVAVGAYAPQRVLVDALEQFRFGVGTFAVEEAAPEDVPDCLAPSFAVEVRSAHAPLAQVRPRYAVGDWFERCAGAAPELAEACAVVDALPAAVSADARPQLLLEPQVAWAWGAPGATRAGMDLGRALDERTCTGALGHVPLSWLPHEERPHPHAARFAALRLRFDNLLRRVSAEPADGAGADLRPALSALASVGALARPATFDLEPGGPLGPALPATSFFIAAAEVKAVARAWSLADTLGFGSPYDALLLDAASAPVPSEMALSASATRGLSAGLGDGFDCALVRVDRFRAEGFDEAVESVRGVGHMLEVLEALADAIEARHWPARDAGVPDVGAIDAGVPDAAPPEPDAGAPAPDIGPLPACEPDPFEANETWEAAVPDGRRFPRGGAELELTLPPGDEDWFAFEITPVFPPVTARVTASPVCEWADQEVCLEGYLWTWSMAELGLADAPQLVLGPTCGLLSDGVSVGPRGAAGLLGDAWVSIVVRVFRRDGEGLAPAGYHLSFTQ